MEVLIVVGVFSMISAACYSAISQYINISEALESRAKMIQRLDRMFLLIDRDIRYAIPRSVRRDVETREPSFISLNTDGLPGEVIRMTSAYPGFNDSGIVSIHRIAWQIDGGQIFRNVWSNLDNNRDVQSISSLQLEGVTDLSIEEYFWSDDYGLQASSQFVDENQNPSGVRLTLLMEDGREYERLIDLADGL